MRYWWVSQNQTFNHEVMGGYLWAPKRNRRNQETTSYTNMKRIAPGDLIFSFANRKIMAIGVAIRPAYSSLRPRVFAKAGEAWNEDGWKVDVHYVSTEIPIEPRSHMERLAPVLPLRNSPLQRNGNGNQVYLCEIGERMANELLFLCNSAIPAVPVMSLDDLAFDEEEQELIAMASLKETEKATLVMARRGQGIFRSRVQILEKSCRVTGVSAEKLLVASHIKPWKISEQDERLDGNNGLFLSPHVDKLFDSGLITFTARGRMEVSPQLDLDVLVRWKIDPSANYGRFNSDQEYFLEYHNKEKFLAA